MLKLSPRLDAAASLVRDNAKLADVGCDHGFLSVYLLVHGKIRSAVASDVNEGPLSRCRELVKKCSLQDRVKCVLCDGLEKIDPDEAEDIVMCGMGGELIVHILEACPWAESSGKHFIFNPMTHPEKVREYLCSSGFEINRDLIVKDGNYFYSVFDAYYTGKAKMRPRWYYYLGKIDDFSNREYFEHLLKFLKNKGKGGSDFSDVIMYIEAKL